MIQTTTIDSAKNVPPNTTPVFCRLFQNNSSSVAVSMPLGRTFFVCTRVLILDESMKSSNSTRLCLPGALLVVVSAERGGCGVHDWLVEGIEENLFSRTGRGVFGSWLANVAIHRIVCQSERLSAVREAWWGHFGYVRGRQ